MTTSPPLKTWLPSWIFLTIVWGMSFYFIKISGSNLSPLQIAFGRVALGALTVLIILLIIKQKLPNTKKAWGRANIAGFLQHTAPFALIAYGETQITSVLAGITNAATPLWTALFSMAFIPKDRISRNEYLGVLTGFVGVLVLIGIWEGNSGENDLLGILAVVVATACYGGVVIYTRAKVTELGFSPSSFIGAQLSASAIQLLILCLIFTSVPTQISSSTWGAILFLGIFSTGLAFPLVYKIIRDVSSLAAATITYATPIVSTIAGVIFLSEGLHWYQPIGAALILVGVGLVQGIRLNWLWSRRGDLNP
ncbi:MAG: EamA family transporter [Actinobacteria bacterium]|nr:EamA family transporter [Actinomycetota bacterium]